MVRIGILGCGGFAGAHARRLKAIPDIQVAALCDVSPAAMESLVQRRLADVDPAPQRFSDPRTMVAEANLDGVVVVTPHALHYEHAALALEAGCHVLLEKPMVTRTGDARALATLAETSGRILLPGFNPPFTATFQFLRHALRTGTCGRLELVNGYLGQDWKRLTAETWRQVRAVAGGGQAWDSGAHLLGGLLWAVDAPVEDVAAFSRRQGTEVDINSVVIIHFTNGVLASLAVGGNCPTSGSHASYLCDGGRFDIDPWNGDWIKAWRGQDPLTDLPAGGAEPNPDLNFVQAIQGQAIPLCTPELGVHYVELMEAIEEAAGPV